MGLKDLNIIAPNMSFAELGMDSIMTAEIKQMLNREFDISLTAQDIRNLNFAKLKKMTNITEQDKIYDATEADTNDLNGLKIMTRKLNDSDMISDIYVQLATKREVPGTEIFLIPGIDGSGS
ncbi:fatty acid synthase, partial [Lasius niger]